VVPILGGSVLALFLLAWVTAAGWLFTRPGLPLT
jgi:hypothetical protein